MTGFHRLSRDAERGEPIPLSVGSPRAVPVVLLLALRFLLLAFFPTLAFCSPPYAVAYLRIRFW